MGRVLVFCWPGQSCTHSHIAALDLVGKGISAAFLRGGKKLEALQTSFNVVK